jgi:SAM-dependent methyltransferase
LSGLPIVSPQHRYYKEWIIRRQSADRIIRYAQAMHAPLHILEVGCGNGWLSAYLAREQTVWQVTGTDINSIELEQAQRVFEHLPNLRFVAGDLRNGCLGDTHYDLIIFAASIQYFPSLKEVIQVALAHTTLNGGVHLVDSPLYAVKAVAAAAERTQAYYAGLGFEDMAGYYFHHHWQELRSFDYSILYDPGHLLNRLRRRRSPFFHVVIKNHYL